MTRYAFQIPIGDWSADGHGQCDWFAAEADKPIDKVREAFFAAKEMWPNLNPETFCCDYEDSLLPADIVAGLAEHGVCADETDAFGPEDMAEIVVWFLNQGDKELNVKLTPAAKLPSLAFYGFDKKERHIGGLGYGLFF